jgi:hypothetical protein
MSKGSNDFFTNPASRFLFPFPGLTIAGSAPWVAVWIACCTT